MNRIVEWPWWSEARAIATRLARCGSSDAAEDLAQDLAIRALEDGAAAERPGAWLERVARNRVIDSWRAERRRGELALEIEPPSPSGNPEMDLLAQERRRVVRRALVTLPRDQRRAALLRYHGSLPFDAVAARLGTEPATARTRVHRALARLRAGVQGLRALFVGWHGAQATALGLAMAGAAGLAPPVSSRAPQVERAAPAAHATRTPRAERGPAPVPPAPPPTQTDERAPTKTRHARQPDPSPEAQVPPIRQEFHFEDDFVDGTTRGPEDEPIIVAQPTAQPSLIEVRRHFIPEMLKAFEDL